MTIAELKELLSKHPDDMEVVIPYIGEAAQITSLEVMYVMPKTRGLFRKAEKGYQKALVLWTR